MPTTEKKAFLVPNSEIHFFPFSSGSILFNQDPQKLIILNNSASITWCLLDQAASLDELVKEVSSRFDISLPIAQQDVQKTISYLSEEGMLGDDKDKPLEGSPRRKQVAKLSNRRVPDPLSWEFKNIYQPLNKTIGFCTSDHSIFQSYDNLMGHNVKKDVEPEGEIWVERSKNDQNKWDIIVDNHVHYENIEYNSVLPRVMYLTYALSCWNIENNLMFHSAVLKVGGKVVLFPGSSGNGKTSLTVALIKKGWQYFSDELALLDPANLEITAMPLAMKIKPLAVPALEKYYPKISDLTIYERADKKLVRYWLPEAEKIPAKGARSQVHSIVFPKFDKDSSENSLKEINKLDAMKYLVQTASSDHIIVPDEIKAIIKVIEEKPCYELIFSDLHKAVSQVCQTIS